MAWLAQILKHKRDIINSDSWAQKALSSNNLFGIGFCNFHGLGTEANIKNAISFFEASANHGDEIGQFWLGCVLEFRSEPEVGKSLFWFLKSAEQGFASAQFKVAEAYKNGNGCEKDKAIFWYKKVAKQGNVEAKIALGELLDK